MKTLKYILVSLIAIFYLVLVPQAKAAVYTSLAFFEGREQKTIYCLTHICESTIIDTDYSTFFDLYIVSYRTLAPYSGTIYSAQSQSVFQIVDWCFSGIRCISVDKATNGTYTIAYWVSLTGSPDPDPIKPGEGFW